MLEYFHVSFTLLTLSTSVPDLNLKAISKFTILVYNILSICVSALKTVVLVIYM